MTAREQGRVLRFNAAKGAGRIQADADGAVLFVLFAGIRGEGFRFLEHGQRVEFTRELYGGPQKWQALDVVVIAEPVSQAAGARIGASALWDRSRAFALDYLIVAAYLAILVAGGVALRRYSPSVSGALFGGPVVGQVTGFLLITLPVTCYFALSEASARQATWGKARMGLRVAGRDGRRISGTRSFGRSAVKFAPWELAHACVWQVNFAANPSSPIYAVGFVVVWLMVGANLVSVLVSPAKQTLYDRLAGTVVERVIPATRRATSS